MEEGSAEKPSEGESKAKSVGRLPMPLNDLWEVGPPSIPNESLKAVGLRVLRRLSDDSCASEGGSISDVGKSVLQLGGSLDSVDLMKLSTALLPRGISVKRAESLISLDDAVPKEEASKAEPLKASNSGVEMNVKPKRIPSVKAREPSLSKGAGLPKPPTPKLMSQETSISTAKANVKPSAEPVAAAAKQKIARDWSFAPTTVDTELLIFETQDYISTGNTFYNLGPKAVVESLPRVDALPQSQQISVPEMGTVSGALVGFDEIKGLYDSPTDLIPWDCSLKTSASGSCMQICKLPPVQYATALSVWSELLLHQKSQFISVLGGCHHGTDRAVPSLLAGFGLLSGFAVKEQMLFINSVNRIYDVLAQWSTIVSPDKGEWSLCQWRWIIGFNGTGQARCISLTGSVISEPPPADEGLLKIVLLTVQSALSGDSTPQVLGLPGLSSNKVQDSLLHGCLVHFKESERSSEGLLAIKEVLRTTLGCNIMEATSIIRICLAYWVLCRGANLRSEDLDFTEQLLGAQAGQIRMIYKQCSGQDEDLARQLRNALYEGLFYFVIQLANKEVQRSFHPLMPVKPFSPQSRALEIIIEEAPFSNSSDGPLSFAGFASQALQALHLGVGFRGIHNLQRVLDADEVKLPVYLDSIRQKPHVQLLLQLLFSRHGGLFPFLAGGPRNMEDLAAWMEFASSKPCTQEVLNASPDGSLLIDWLGQWSRTDLAELTRASSTIKGPTFRLIGSLLRSASATRMCGRITNCSSAARVLQAVQDSLAINLVERPVLVVRSSDYRLTSWMYEELRKVEDWQSFGFPVVARLEDLPKYCPRLFGEAASGEKNDIIGTLAQYIDLKDFAMGKTVLFFRSAAYNLLYAFELAAKSIEEERRAKLRILERQREDLQAWKAKVQGSTGKEGARLHEVLKSPTSVRLASGDSPVDQRHQSRSSEGVHLNTNRSGSSRSVVESRKRSDSSSAVTSAEDVKSFDASARKWQSCPVSFEPESDRRDKSLRPSVSLGALPSSSEFVQSKGGKSPADLLLIRQNPALNNKMASFAKAKGVGSTLSVGKGEAPPETIASVKKSDPAVSVEQLPLSAAGKSKPETQQNLLEQPKKPPTLGAQMPPNTEGPPESSKGGESQQQLENEGKVSDNKNFQELDHKDGVAQKGSVPHLQPADELPPVEEKPLVTLGSRSGSKGGKVDKETSEANSKALDNPLGTAETTGHVVETRDASKRTADKEAEEHIASLAVLPETSTQEQTIRALSPSPAKAVVTDEHSSQERKTPSPGGIRAMWRTNKKDIAWRGLVVIPKEHTDE